MTRMLYRLGGAAAAHPWRTLGIWLAVVALAAGLAGVAGGTPQDDWNVPGTASQAGTDLLREEFPSASGAVDRVVVHDRDGDLYILRHDVTSTRWELTFFRSRDRKDGPVGLTSIASRCRPDPV